MLALADKYGVVEGSIPGLADMARLSIAETQESLLLLHSPDEFSRTTDHEGRRVKTIDGGWQILNHGKYREKMNADERREYLRIKKAESRERQENRSTTVNNRQQSSTPVPSTGTLSTHAECRVQSADPLIERESMRPKDLNEASEYAKGQGLPTDSVSEWYHQRDSQGWQKNSGVSITNWRSDLQTWIIKNARGSHDGSPKGGKQPTIKKEDQKWTWGKK